MPFYAQQRMPAQPPARQAFGNVSNVANRGPIMNQVAVKAHMHAPQMATDFTEMRMPMEMPVSTDFEDVMHNMPVISMQAPSKPQTSEVVEMRLPSGETRVMTRTAAEAHGATPAGHLVAVSSSQINFARVANPAIPSIPEGSEQILEVYHVPGHAMHHQQDPHMMHQEMAHAHMAQPPQMHHYHQMQQQQQQQQMQMQMQMQMHQQQQHQVQMVRQAQHMQAPGHSTQPTMAYAPEEASVPKGAQVFNPEYWQQQVDKQVDTALRREAGVAHHPQQQPMVNPQNVYDFADANYYQRQMPGYQFTGEASL